MRVLVVLYLCCNQNNVYKMKHKEKSKSTELQKPCKKNKKKNNNNAKIPRTRSTIVSVRDMG